MSTTQNTPSIDQLQLWANEPETACQNLPLIFAALDAPELLDWANETLENCGCPELSALQFLNAQLAAPSSDGVYWACKLIGRFGAEANASQEALCQALELPRQTDVVRQQVLLALSRIGELTSSTLASVKHFSTSPNVRVAELAHGILRPKS